jgi:DNA-binding transcriptional LysR family regulator
MLSMLDPRRLRLLVELADRGTISAVAEELHFTPSTVSHGLSALERDVGVPLLERSPRSVRLTDAGRSLAREGRSILGRLGAAESDARAVGRLDRGELVISSFASAGATLLADAAVRLGDRHPGLELHLLDAEPDESLDRLAAGDIDVAIVYEYPHLPAPDLAGLSATHLADDPIRVCLPAGHPQADGGEVKLRALRDEAFAAGRVGSSCHAFLTAVCRRAGFEPRIAFETDDIAFTCALVRAGMGVAVMPELLLGTAPQPILTRNPAPGVGPRRISAVHRASASGLTSIRAVLAALREAAEGRAAPRLPAVAAV